MCHRVVPWKQEVAVSGDAIEPRGITYQEVMWRDSRIDKLFTLVCNSGEDIP